VNDPENSIEQARESSLAQLDSDQDKGQKSTYFGNPIDNLILSLKALSRLNFAFGYGSEKFRIT
jgi:hypothetical protein